jgi:16S rRNA (guanine527-N7)-methyltransferase
LKNIPLQDVSRETLSKVDALFELHEASLSVYADRLLWWNRKVNVISRDMTREDVMLHIKHSLFLAPAILQSPLHYWIDTGTGGGLPGIPLAIVCKDIRFTLNDVVTKKGIVLKDVCTAMKLDNTHVQIMDIGAISVEQPFGVVTKHAFKMMDLLNRLAGKPWQELLMLKGSDYASEYHELSNSSITIDVTSLEAASPQSFFTGKHLIRICPTH